MQLSVLRFSKHFMRFILLIISLFLAYLAGLLLVNTIQEYSPNPSVPGETVRVGAKKSVPDTVLSFLTWNLGYAGLGAENDFFYSKGSLLSFGHDVIPTLDQHRRYQGQIEQFVRAQRIDFYLFQEIDRASKRSYLTDQVVELAEELPGFHTSFFPNYKVDWVPVPLLEPWNTYGRVLSGLATLSRYTPTGSTRLALPGQFSWPTRLFLLDRCLGVSRFRLHWGRDLIVINLHNEAYDKGGDLKKQQLDFLKVFLEKEYKKGNYVVVGGDWNQSAPYFNEGMLRPAYPKVQPVIGMDPTYMPSDWRWVFDPSVPTNRSIDAPYRKGTTPVALIDYFLVSPNIQILQVKGFDLGFAASDHQPVWMEVRLKE